QAAPPFSTASRPPRSCSAYFPPSRSPSCSSAIWSRAWRSAGRRAKASLMTREIPMKRLWSATSVAFLLGALVTLGWLAVPGPARSARPYEGTTIRAVVNAEFVKYSLSLVEQDLYDKLGVKLETEVIPADAFVAKTLLEFNSGGSPWDLVMFGPSNMPDYGRHFEPLEPWIEKLKLDFAMDDIVPVFAKVMLRYQGKLVSMPYDGDIHIMYWNKVAFERPDNRAKFKAKYKYDLQPPQPWNHWAAAAEFFHGWGWDGSQAKLFGAGASYKPSGSGYSYHWWRSRFFSYGGQYFDAHKNALLTTR